MYPSLATVSSAISMKVYCLPLGPMVLGELRIDPCVFVTSEGD